MEKYNIESIRKDFPILFTKKVNNNPFVYFDNAASTFIPKPILNELYEFQLYNYSSIHRSSYLLAEECSVLYEKSRSRIANFINAKKKEVIITSGTTFSINLIAKAYSRRILKKNDEILITALEHHSNYLPWVEICKETESILKILPIDFDGNIKLDIFESLLSKKTKMIALSHISNVLGTILPVKEMIKKIKNYNPNIKVLLDGAQAISHKKVNMIDLNCDFYVFSGHKMYSSTGVGILYIKENLFDSIDPFITGGGMVENIEKEAIQYKSIPNKLEAGTPPTIQVIGLAKSIDYLESIGIENIQKYENSLLKELEEHLKNIPQLKILGNPHKRSSILSFYFDKIHPHDISSLLDQYGICIRSGQHCCQPLMDYYKIPGTNRVSFGIYNTKEEIEYFLFILSKIVKIFFKIMDLEKLYSDLILYHNQFPTNFLDLPEKTHLCKGNNPLCGDRYEIFLKVKENFIEKIHFLGVGCAISKSSISLMINFLEGKSFSKGLETIVEFKKMILYDKESKINLGKLDVFKKIQKIPSRKKCVLIGWYILDCALNKRKQIDLNE